MSVNSILGSALTGLAASQAGMRTTSNNISNVNTPGYAREEIQYSSRTLGGASSGVGVDGIRRVTDAFLVATALGASARATGAATVHDLLDRVQSFFGDPSSGTSIFSNLNGLFAGFAEAAADPSSPVRRAASISDLRASLNEFDRLANEIQSVRAEADSRIAHVVDRVNDLLDDVGQLNTQIAQSRNSGGASGAENALSQVLDELSELIDIRVVQQSSGAVEVRTQDGLLLAGHTVAKLSYDSIGVAAPGDTHPNILVQAGSAAAQVLDPHLGAGELRGLLDVRDRELPAIAGVLGEFAAKTADSLNQAHAQATSYPPRQTLAGRDTGLLGTDAHGFEGSTTLTVLDSGGALASTIEIDFDANTINVDGAGAVAIGGAGTLEDVRAAIDGALGAGSATLSNGVLTLDAGAGRGLAFAEGDPASSRGGRTFSHYFGLNDLVTSARPLFYETGFQAGDAHGFTTGAFTLRLEGAAGSTLREATVSITAGEDFSDIIADLNDASSGFGAFGTFALSTEGELKFSPTSSFEGVQFKVLSDTTERGGSVRTFTDLFGVGEGTRAARAFNLKIRADVDSNPARLALGKVNLSGVGIGDVVTGAGDGAGGGDLRAAGSRPIAFGAAGGFPAMVSTVLDYAGRVAGDVGRRANTAEREHDAAVAVRAEAVERRASVEGVNIEEELVKLTTFQQSFNAATRLIQAAKEMSDTLMSII